MRALLFATSSVVLALPDSAPFATASVGTAAETTKLEAPSAEARAEVLSKLVIRDVVTGEVVDEGKDGVTPEVLLLKEVKGEIAALNGNGHVDRRLQTPHALTAPDSNTNYIVPPMSFFFDLIADSGSDVEVKSLRVQAETAGTVTIYARPAPSVSYNHTFWSQGDWASVHTESVQASETKTIQLPEDLVVPAGQTRALLISYTGNMRCSYPAGPQLLNYGGPYPALASDAYLTLSHSFVVPSSYLFGASYYPTGYNINALQIGYDLSDPPPTTESPTAAPITAAPVPAPGPLCPASDPTKYDMCIDTYDSGATYQNDWTIAFQSAKVRWEEIITGDTPAYNAAAAGWSVGNCDSIPDVVDDLYICAEDGYIDGAGTAEGNILGSAGPTLIWTTGLPITGRMVFDTHDIDNMMSEGKWENVVLHEMAHVLGIGTLWEYNAVVTGNPPDCSYVGAQGCEMWRNVTGCSGCPPMERDYGEGTMCGHWDEEVLDDELMTGFVEYGAMPISKITVGSLADMGYTVDLDAADEYSLPSGCSRRNLRTSNNVRNLNKKGRKSGDVVELHPAILSAEGSQKKKRKISDATKVKAKGFGKKLLHEAKEKRKAMNLDDTVGFVGDKFVEVIVQDVDGSVYFVEVNDEECLPNGADCESSDDCCSDNCHGNGKCVGAKN